MDDIALTAGIVLICLATFIGGLFSGFSYMNDSWIADCKKLELHVSDRVIYDCKERK